MTFTTRTGIKHNKMSTTMTMRAISQSSRPLDVTAEKKKKVEFNRKINKMASIEQNKINIKTKQKTALKEERSER
jgi:hypothetical protein